MSFVFRSSLLIFTVLLFSACGTAPVKPDKQTDRQNSQAEQPSTNELIYYFQHRLISQWLFQSDSRFFNDLYNGYADKLINAAEELIGADYADEIYVTPLTEHNAVLITFPEPESVAICYHALLVKNGSSLVYYTYEKSFSLADDDPVFGVVGSWSTDGQHNNHGGRTYTTGAEFVADVLGE
jgi:hypothetical protein